MASSDLSVLLEMGFDSERAEMAVKKSGGLQGALEWLETNQDKSIEGIRAAEIKISSNRDPNEDPNAEPPALKEGEVARSLVCNECGKKFRSTAQAEFHASKTEHQDFSESTEEIAPLTEEEKKEKLAELRVKAAAKKATQVDIDREEAKKNEKIRMKSTQEIQHIKEELEKKERIKEAQKKRQEKADDIAAKKRIQEKIAADKEDRRLKAEQQKAEREGRNFPSNSTAVAEAPSSVPKKPAAAHTEARLRLQTASGNVMKTFPAETTLFEVAQALGSEGILVTSFTQAFPKKVFEGNLDFGKTLKEAGFVPSAALIIK